jgi:hypothetical protein
MAKLFKVFAKQAGVKALDVNKYLMNQVVVQVDTPADLDTVLTKAGVRVAFSKSDSALYYYNGTTWEAQITQKGINAGFGMPTSGYITSDYQGASTTSVMAAGTYFIPIRIEAVTQIKNMDIYCATYVGGVTQAMHCQFYSSKNGRPRTPIGTDVGGATISAVGYSTFGFSGPTYTLAPGLYFAAFAFTGTLRSHTYAAVTQSATSGGPNYLSMTAPGDYTNLTLKPRPGFFSTTQYGSTGGLTAWPIAPGVSSVATAPVVRMLCNYNVTQTNDESGLYA